MTKQNNRKKGEVKMLLGLTGTAAALAGGALVSTNVAHADTVDQPSQPVVQQTATDPAQTAKDNLQTAQTKADQAAQAQNEAQMAYDQAQGQLNQAHQAVANDQQAVQTAQDHVNQTSQAVQSAQAGGPTVTADQVNQASQEVAQAQQAANQAQQQVDQAATAVTRAQQAVDQAQAGNKNTAAQASQAAQEYLQAQFKMGQAEQDFDQGTDGTDNWVKNAHHWTPSEEINNQQEAKYLNQLYQQSLRDHGQLTLPSNLPSNADLEQAMDEYRDQMSSQAQDQASVLRGKNLTSAERQAVEANAKLLADYYNHDTANALNDGQWDAAAMANSFYPGLSKLDAWKYYANQFGADGATDPNLKVPAQYKNVTDYYDHNLTPWSKSLTWHSTAKDQQELLPEIAVKHADGSVTYDLSKLSDQHLIELNRFGMDILNQIRLRLPNPNGVGAFVGFNTAILDAAKHAAQVYTQDNWHYLDKGDHDTRALANKDNVWAYGENVDARRDNFAIKSMDDLKHALWLNLREGLFNDGTSNWGHTHNFLDAGFAAFAFDNVTPQGWWQNWVRSGQMHFLTSNGDYGVGADSTNLYHLDGNDDYKRVSVSVGYNNISLETPSEDNRANDHLNQAFNKAGISSAQQQIKNVLAQQGLKDALDILNDAVKQDARNKAALIADDSAGYQKLQQALKEFEAARDKYASTPGVGAYIWDSWMVEPMKTHPVTTNSSLDKAQKDLNQAQANKAKADQALKDAQKQLTDRQAQLKDLQQRAKTLPEAQADYAKAQKALADAQKQLAADQEALQTAQTNQAKAKQALAAAQKNYQTAQADLATARQAYAKTQAHDNLNNQVAHQAEQLNRNDHRTGNTSAQAGTSMTVSVVNGASHVAAAAGKVAQAEVNHLTATAQQAAGAVKDAKLPQTGAAQASSNWAVLGLASLLGFIGFGGRRKFRA
ncbi:SEC10/PgrA surface exclusion domain-containing protein [Limosilactobacillus ingluviei]|uniref:SEC10/PgrA surface exclusion domain-containing protein n=1 Tax=Limosilactobacillus ingluviei TaxID=148604 RepID=UPI0003045FAB|nr:SEC10/PgrA surface exclusion domain-containing protein [Limosilactobacillus ingluviei]